MTVKAAIYARVSTDDKGQDPRNQTVALKEFATREGLEIVEEYIDFETGTGKRRRAAFEKMLYDAERHRFQILAVWALDRLTREGTLKTLLLIDRLESMGVRVRSLQESWLDPSSPTYELLVSVFSWTARAESLKISARIRAGLIRARMEGRRLGRPPKVVDEQLVLRALTEQGSIRKASLALGISRSKIWRIAKEMRVAATA